MTEQAHFQVDPAHSAQEGLYAASFAYDQPIALRRGDDEQPLRKVPATRTRKVPVVLDVTCTVDGATFEPLPLDQVVTVRVYDARQRQLAAFAIADDGERSVLSKSDFAHDIGPTFKTIGHLRMAAPAVLDAHLRETPGDAVTIVGFDAQGRIMLVAEADGYIDAETGITKGVRVGKSVVWLGQHKDYEPRDGALIWRYTTSFVHDEPVALPPDQVIGDLSPKTKKAPAKYLAKAPLLLDLSCSTPDYIRKPALAKVATIYIFGPAEGLLATRVVAKDCSYTASTCQLTDESGTSPYTIEHLRTALDPALFAGMRGANVIVLWVVAVDAEGKTVVAELSSPPDVAAVTTAPAPRSGVLPPPRPPIGPIPDEASPGAVGVATMDGDGTLRLHLRSQEGDGPIAEALLIIPKTDERYQRMLAHLGGLEPGESRAIPAFPEPVIDPDSIAP